MAKHRIHRELKNVKKYLPVDENFLHKLHEDLSDLELLKKRSNNRIPNFIKFAVSISCCLVALIICVFVMPRLGIGGDKLPINPEITDSSVAENDPSSEKENALHEFGDLLVVCADDKFGFMNLSGEMVIEPQFDYASEFNEYGVATVMNYINGRKTYGLLGLNGLLTDFNLWDIGDFHEGLAKAKNKEGKYGFIDTTGKWVVQPIYDNAMDFSEGMAAVGLFSETERWGFVDKNGNVIVEPQYQRVKSFSNGLAFVEEQGSWQISLKHYIDKTGDKVITLPWNLVLDSSSFDDDGTAIVQKVSEEDMSIGMVGVINRQGDIVLPFDYSFISEATDGLRLASPVDKSGSNLCGVIDEKGNWVVEPKYYEVSSIKNGLITATVLKDGRPHSGILKVDGTWLYEPIHYSVFSFKDDMVVFVEERGYHGVGVVMSLYDLKGNQLLGGRKFNQIEILSKDYIRCGTDVDTAKGIVSWSIFTPDGNEFMPGTNMRTAHLMDDGNVLATVLKEDEFYTGLVDPKTEKWIIEPIYYNVIKYSGGVGVGIRKIKEKCTEETIVFVAEVFDSLGKIKYTSKEQSTSLDIFQGNRFTSSDVLQMAEDKAEEEIK
ncbi:WG repeat-containing protein [Acetivibrio mesophilus]|uniref:WG repeat-containing protein n=1 Tax=Acetivibrio mesophilus TaxID=2487273 RepID=A0A4Q0I2U5_9FIRM|nr:WG repeat-containing protein [Acetivibrio mesophilus]RXE58491.1 WG repeat-containing protein [Acetivibrio mesophilus]HHV28771.1 WG repeat-containing protein [Clostridium sp.]